MPQQTADFKRAIIILTTVFFIPAQTLERYFQMRINISPYRHNALKSFLMMLISPPHLLKDFIQLMRYEMKVMRNTNVKWLMSLSLTVHPRASFAPAGMSSIIVKDDKVLVFIHLTQNQASAAIPQQQTQQQQQQHQSQPISIDIPLLLTPHLNTIDLLNPALNSLGSQLPYLKVVSQMLGNLRTQQSLQMNMPPTSPFSNVALFLMENLVVRTS